MSRPRSSSPTSRPRPAFTLLAIVTAVGLVSVVLTLFWARSETFLALPEHLDVVKEAFVVSVPHPAETHAPAPDVVPSDPAPDPAPAVDPWRTQVAQWVVGAPTQHLADNLRPDTQYVTTWINGGWTNDFMTYINLVYLALLTGRTPVLPPFAPSHVAYDAGFPHFGDVFDVPRLSAALGAPVLEWRDVKHENSSETDALGCWSIWSLVSDAHVPRGSAITDRLNLDVSYTALPGSTERIPRMPDGLWLPFSSLAELSAPARRTNVLAQHPPQTGPLPPDAHLLCFDFMYYVGAVRHDEWWADWSPAWRVVGRHAVWTEKLEQIARGYVRRALALPDDEDANSDAYPPYIGVHVRRGDFTATCGTTPKEDCFPPLASYAQSVAAVRAALLSQKGLTVPPDRVLVTSDEADPAWWAGVAALGWRRADHAAEATEARLGRWFLPLIDAVIQSRGVGFVGTDRSTMSLVARRRVEAWQGGVGELVKMGKRA